MSIRRRETKAGVRYDVQWRLPDRSKRKKTFISERAAKQFEAKLVTSSGTGESLDPRGGRTDLETVYRSWMLRAPTSAPKSAADTKTTGDCVSNRTSATGRSQRSTTSPFSGG